MTGHPGLADLDLASLTIHIVSVTVQKMLLHMIFSVAFPRSEWVSSRELSVPNFTVFVMWENGLYYYWHPAIMRTSAVGPSEGRTELNVCYFLITSSIPWGREEGCSLWKDKKGFLSQVICAKTWDCGKKVSGK